MDLNKVKLADIIKGDPENPRRDYLRDEITVE